MDSILGKFKDDDEVIFMNRARSANENKNNFLSIRCPDNKSDDGAANPQYPFGLCTMSKLRENGSYNRYEFHPCK